MVVFEGDLRVWFANNMSVTLLLALEVELTTFSLTLIVMWIAEDNISPFPEKASGPVERHFGNVLQVNIRG